MSVCSITNLRHLGTYTSRGTNVATATTKTGKTRRNGRSNHTPRKRAIKSKVVYAAQEKAATVSSCISHRVSHCRTTAVLCNIPRSDTFKTPAALATNSPSGIEPGNTSSSLE